MTWVIRSGGTRLVSGHGSAITLQMPRPRSDCHHGQQSICSLAAWSASNKSKQIQLVTLDWTNLVHDSQNLRI